MEYLDLDLIVERSGDRYVARVFNSPGGQASASFTLPFSDLELEAFVRQASQAEIAAYRSLDASPLQSVYSGQLLALYVADIATLAANGVAAVRTLSSQQGNGVQVSPDGQSGQVTVTERWSTDFVLPLNGQCLQHIHEQDLTRTFMLQRAGTGWMAYAVQQPSVTPQLVPCH